MNSALITDVDKHRKDRKYTRMENFQRLLWEVGKLFFRFSPRPCFGWRRLVLRIFGAKIGKEVRIYSSTLVYMPWNLQIGEWSCIGENTLVYNLGKITIGRCTTISQRAHLCAGTHDYLKSDFALLKPPINISDNAWICSDAFVGPDVTIGEGAVIGARAVVVSNVEPWAVVAGNPAKVIKKRIMRS